MWWCWAPVSPALVAGPGRCRWPAARLRPNRGRPLSSAGRYGSPALQLAVGRMVAACPRQQNPLDRPGAQWLAPSLVCRMQATADGTALRPSESPHSGKTVLVFRRKPPACFRRLLSGLCRRPATGSAPTADWKTRHMAALARFEGAGGPIAPRSPHRPQPAAAELESASLPDLDDAHSHTPSPPCIRLFLRAVGLPRPQRSPSRCAGCCNCALGQRHRLPGHAAPKTGLLHGAAWPATGLPATQLGDGGLVRPGRARWRAVLQEGVVPGPCGEDETPKELGPLTPVWSQTHRAHLSPCRAANRGDAAGEWPSPALSCPELPRSIAWKTNSGRWRWAPAPKMAGGRNTQPWWPPSWALGNRHR